MRVWVFTVLPVFAFACTSDSESVQEADVPHGYYYFPKPNVYYDTADKNFVYFDSASRQWQKGNLPPAYIQKEMGKSILLDSAPDPVWSGNMEHRLVYSAKLYADTTDFKKEEPRKEVVRKPDTKNDAADEPRRKTRVGKFFDRIFGKKD